MRADQGWQHYVFFTNGEECGNNTAHCTAGKYCSVLTEKNRILVTDVRAGICPEPGTEDTI